MINFSLTPDIELEPPPRPAYPYFGMHRDLVVLFVAPYTGTVVKANQRGENKNNVGDYSDNWMENNFIFVHGTLDL